MKCVSTSEKTETIENGEQEVSDMPCQATLMRIPSLTNHVTTATSEVISKDEQVEKSEKEDKEDKKKDEMEESKEKAPTKMESELEEWSKNVDDALEAAGD